jgi:hypothetical protein
MPVSIALISTATGHVKNNNLLHQKPIFGGNFKIL